ncbi:MAG: SUMF1/EgtB/PvdO family nonheme iron enzyme [Planctomycetes bacterium]|nr:SUMF1/EgtB/PvdO family nonheme iron enzyme [Planctomycetota bacterium]
MSTDAGRTSAHEVFAAWIACNVAEDDTGFASLLARHAEHATVLRELRARWIELDPVLRLLGRDAKTGEALAERLEALHGKGIDPRIELESASNGGAGEGALLGSLRKKVRASRYVVEKEIARGGMGAILRVWDEDIRRHIAMKIALDRETEPGASASADARMLARFLEEAQVTGQLEHPGIVPVHELGMDSSGRVFFTMRLVRGRDLRVIYDHVFGGHDGWSETRALSVVLKVCEAVAYAHKKGVIHRDLKPANVMVGDFGEVYVMDWGLARVIGRPDQHDVRIAPESVVSRSVRTERRETREDTPDSPIVTMDGDVVGTPAYMAPEQARGEVEKLDARADVYSIGAMLYHLFTRQMPYAPRGARVSNRTVLGMVLQAPPQRVHELRKDLPDELAAICEKAMAREAPERYATTLELAEDLRAYLEHRVVRAHRTGAWAELRKWVERNRGTAIAVAALVLATIGGAFLFARARANANHRELLLVDARLGSDLVASEPKLWPALPTKLDDLQAWIADADGLAARRAEHEALLLELEANAGGAGRAAQMRELLRETSPKLDELLPLVVERRDRARSIERETVTSDSARIRWQSASEAIAAHPAYRGLKLAPQIGLVPLGPDPESKLWEFWHVNTGAEPVRDPATGRWKITRDTGIVLVLLPGATTTMGGLPMAPSPTAKPGSGSIDRLFDALRDSPDWGKPWHDPAHDATDEEWIEQVELAPFFLSKYEMTRGQWVRLMRSNPSQHEARKLELPVETVSWYDARDALARCALELPTEAQWEYACRAASAAPFWTGWELRSLQGAANIADATLARALGTELDRELSQEVDDGFAGLAPVDTLRPSPFGLHHMHGNVWEWCRDGYRTERAPRTGDGLDEGAESSRTSSFRGGGYNSPAHEARAANRFADFMRDNNDSDLGVRPARRVE